MESGPYNNVSALAALARRYDALTQDVANAATPGYRQRRAADAAFSTAMEDVHRVAADLRVDDAAGATQNTGDPLDIALAGPGYLAAQGEQGSTLLTRRGDLQVRGGFLTTASGAKILGDAGPIPIPEGADVAISEAGDVMAGSSAVGRLRIVTGQDLAPRGKGLYAAKSIKALVGDRPAVISGAREGSNVNLPGAMAELIATQRLYTTNLSAIRQLDQMDDRLLRIRPV